MKHCLRNLLIPFLALSLMTVAVGAQDHLKIAERYGIDHFDDVSAIHFTFNVARGGETVVERAWVWRPKTDTVTAVDQSITYERGDSMDKELDQKFINDQYWLLFPFHLKWDQGVKITENGETLSPIGNKNLKMLTIAYMDDQGYTPGDAYDLYYDDDYKIHEWNFRKGGKADGRPMTWTGEVEMEGMIFSTEHGVPGGARLWFTDLKVETD